MTKYLQCRVNMKRSITLHAYVVWAVLFGPLARCKWCKLTTGISGRYGFKSRLSRDGKEVGESDGNGRIRGIQQRSGSDDPERMSGNPLCEPTPMPLHDAAFCDVMNSHFSCMLDAAIMRLTAILDWVWMSTSLKIHFRQSLHVSGLRLMHFHTHDNEEGL